MCKVGRYIAESVYLLFFFNGLVLAFVIDLNQVQCVLCDQALFKLF